MADSAPSMPNRFWPTYFVLRNFSNASAAFEPVEDVALVLGTSWRVDAFDVLLDPVLLLGIGDVHVLDADRAAVGVAQDVQDVAELLAGAAGEAVGEELAVEVPDREAVGGRDRARCACAAPSTPAGRGRR